MMGYEDLYRRLRVHSQLAKWGAQLPAQIDHILNTGHGDLPKWRAALEALPKINPDHIDFNTAAVTAGTAADCDVATRTTLEHALRQLMPWRKGPFSLLGLDIDTEWRSDWKWDRIAPHITPLTGRAVLDVGCGSGYHCWRMAGAGAELVIGIDPTLIYIMQYFAVRHFTGDHGVFVLPLALEQLPAKLEAFDTVFSMGVLYHRRSPLDHILELRDCLRPGGELVLETLVIEGDEGQVLLPEQRYAKMRNVFFIPSPPTLALWLRRCGFTDVRIVDVSTTTTAEQRRTDWMSFESLEDFLMPGDPSCTVEGHPAPRRATLVANRN
ncbi:MAG: tRNA 5-methoxyuridine(34)/uridine 5-oxyacetic acid(34) synthase CmoB [Gammaproteobacteria bacterium]|nr:tRNA 5-methoxyuridine(34)/uridine 5-oxyacetic acid(34) synthase CmoB [Gammaproteobacteria bacterium]